jgi:exodeoxyribonuclease VII large subunit
VGGLDLFGNDGAVVASERAWTVAEVTRRARQLIDAGFTRLWVRGELTGFKAYRGGHWYFTLRDAQAQVRCVMWRRDNLRLRERPREGNEVFAEVQPTLWEERGEFRLTVRELIPTTAGGRWQLELERSKIALAKDGLLDPARKRPIPIYPRRIAVVTSLDGAALRDIVTIVERRWPIAEVLVLAARVQGDDAERQLCHALRTINRIPNLDLAIVGRGGGSREDLWVFNSERVARAVAAANVPTISAVGHETDISLTDLVADVRAATPSAAAEAAVPDRAATARSVDGIARRLAKALASRTVVADERLSRTGDRLTAATQGHLERRSARLERIAGKLDALSPLRVLERGYAVARDAEGRVLKQVVQFSDEMLFRLRVSDGEVRGRAVLK